MSQPDFTIGIIEDSQFLRHELYEHFSHAGRVKCIVCTDTVEKFLKYYQPDVPIHLLLLDVMLYDLSGIDGLTVLRKRLPDTEIIIFTMLENAETIFKALSRGADGYLVKGIAMHTLEEKILDILEGREAPLSPSVSKTILGYFQKVSAPAVKQLATLSEQEMLVARYLMDGLAYDSIALNLGISVNGVRYHVKKIYGKLEITSRYQLVGSFNVKSK